MSLDDQMTTTMVAQRSDWIDLTLVSLSMVRFLAVEVILCSNGGLAWGLARFQGNTYKNDHLMVGNFIHSVAEKIKKLIENFMYIQKVP